jgi:hypothetical protein
MCFPKPNVPSAADQAAEVAAQETARQQRVKETSGQVNSIFDQKYGPEYYGGIGDAYRSYYKPQVNEQFGEASRATSLRLADRANSSSAQRQESHLLRDKIRADQGVESGAIDAQNNARQDVESKRANLIGMAEAGGSLENTSALARNATESNLGQPTFSPVGDLFAKYANTLSTAAHAADSGQNVNPFYTKQIDFLRGGSKGSQRVIGG